MSRPEPFDVETVRGSIRAALEEDRVGEDATVELLGIGDGTVRADLVAGESLVVAGGAVAARVFREVDARVECHLLTVDGGGAREGDVIGTVEGPAGSILRAERVALNLLQRASGVATLTARFVEGVRGTGVTILDTRKTTPLWRALQKYAVRCGGGSNHRTDLASMVLVKENHVRAIGGVHALIERLSQEKRKLGIVEVEVDSPEMLGVLARERVGIRRVMLDNFTPAQVADALERIAPWRERNPGGTPEIEVSGGITLDTVRAYAVPGVDFISVGALTHSAPAASISLEVQP